MSFSRQFSPFLFDGIYGERLNTRSRLPLEGETEYEAEGGRAQGRTLRANPGAERVIV